MPDKSLVLAQICRSLDLNAIHEAVSVAKRDYPFAPEPITKRKYGPLESTQLFVRDGFVDRYTGERLVFPPVLRILSTILPAEFPYHPNWKTDLTHPSYWELGASVDHLIPVTRGGSDGESNWMTTSMARNFAKMNWTLEELGWTLHPPGEIQRWDGLLSWYMHHTSAHPEAFKTGYFRAWQRAASVAVGGLSQGSSTRNP